MTYIVQDIETIPETEIVDMWDPEAEAKRYGKPVQDDPFPPIWCHKVACIGLLALDEDLKPIKGNCAAGGLTGGRPEKEMIEAWSKAVAGGGSRANKMVDWNGRGFDVPVLQTRAFRYGIQLPWYFGKLPDNKGLISSFSKRYRDRYAEAHLDLQDLWTGYRAFGPPHLANLAKLMGLPGKTGIDGSKVYGAYKEKRYEEIDVYCMQDVIQTAFIFQRFRYLEGKVAIEKYRDAAAELIGWTAEQDGQKEFALAIDEGAVLLE